MVDVGAAPIDRYVVLEHLSEGGMGAIYVGKKLGAGGFEMQVVLKQLLPEFTQQEEFIDLFLREAKLSATRTLTRSNTFPFWSQYETAISRL